MNHRDKTRAYLAIAVDKAAEGNERRARSAVASAACEANAGKGAGDVTPAECEIVDALAREFEKRAANWEPSVKEWAAGRVRSALGAFDGATEKAEDEMSGNFEELTR